MSLLVRESQVGRILLVPLESVLISGDFSTGSSASALRTAGEEDAPSSPSTRWPPSAASAHLVLMKRTSETAQLGGGGGGGGLAKRGGGWGGGAVQKLARCQTAGRLCPLVEASPALIQRALRKNRRREKQGRRGWGGFSAPREDGCRCIASLPPVWILLPFRRLLLLLHLLMGALHGSCHFRQEALPNVPILRHRLCAQ